MFFTAIKFTTRQLKAMTDAYARAERQGDINKMKKLSSLLLLSEGVAVSSIACSLGVTVQAVYSWLKKYMVSGLRGLKSGKSPGRPSKLTKSQRQRLAKQLDAGPLKNGFLGNCWRTPMIQHLINKLFGVFYNVRYISQLLGAMNFSYQKAGFSADKADRQERTDWLENRWPAILAQATEKKALLLFGDESSFPQWGTLTYTWARKGHQPKVLTCGKRKCYKVFGFIDYFTGRFFSKGHHGQLNSESYITFLKEVMKKTRKNIVLIHDGAPYHRSAAVREFLAKHEHRITAHKLPSYSPDFNPIEKLWKKIKEKGTHLVYFPTFDSLVKKVHDVLGVFDHAKQEVLALFGFYDNLEIV